MKTKAKKTKIRTLVLSGGGTKGVAYIGVLKRLDELREAGDTTDITIDIKKICGVSIGCIFGLCIILGFTSAELEDEIVNKDFSQLKDVKLSNFFTHYGLDSGNCIVSWLETLMIKKNVSKDITFQELYDLKKIEFLVYTTNLSKCVPMIFDANTTPHVKIVDAIRLSISLPFIFTAKRYKNDVYVDGGIINNFPIELFDIELDEVLGIHLLTRISETKEVGSTQNIYNYITQILICFLMYKNSHKWKLYEEHTIQVYTHNEIVNFDMSNDEKYTLISDGYEAADMYFK